MPQPLTDAINALTTYANSVTGKTPPDTTLSDAVATLASGYGQGGDDTLNELLTGQLASYDTKELTEMPQYTFYYVRGLLTLTMPNVETLDQYFLGESSVVTVVAPKVTVFRNWRIFTNARNLETIDILGASAAGQYWAQNCAKLATLIIRRTAVMSISDINSFANTPFASGGTGGTLYVPNDLISTYQSASNWSTILGYANNSIKSIESTHTDPNAPIDLTLYYADGTPIQ